MNLGSISVRSLAWALSVAALFSSRAESVSLKQLPVIDTNRVVAVEIKISEPDWNNLRYQHREAEFFPEDGVIPPEDPYTWFPAEVTFDGKFVQRAEIRKKGYIGSNDTRRPSLKLRTIATSTEREAGAAENTPHSPVLDLTLNNNRQDPSMIRQYLAYEVFRRADVPAPRCSFAKLIINGKELGIYTVLEPINTAFLKRHFGRGDGNLYEGGRSDFRSNWVENFSVKKSRAGDRTLSVARRSDLTAATAELERTSGSILPVMTRHFNVEQFFRFWAVESLINANDGYAANMNNFYLYNDPATGKFVFIPWGADSTFYSGRAMNSVRGDPKSVIGVGILANRLYNSNDGASKYRDTLQQVLSSAWDEKALLREIDRLERLLAPHLSAQRENVTANVASVRRFVTSRRSELEPELFGPAPTLKSKPLELAKRRNVGQFTVTFGLNEEGKVSTQCSGTLWDQPISFTDVSLDVQIDESEERRILQFMASTAKNELYVISLAIDPDSYMAGKSIPIDNTHIQGMFGTGERYVGMLRGSLLLTKASKTSNEVAGEFTVDVFSKLPKP